MVEVSFAKQRGSRALRRSKKRVKASSGGTQRSIIARFASALVIVLLWTVTLSFYVLDYYILPRYYYSHEGSRYVKPRMCGDRAISTNDEQDIIMDKNDSLRDVKRMVYKHGAALIPNVLEQDTATELRRTIRATHDDDSREDTDFFVLNKSERRSRLLNVNEDPIYREALHQVATHGTLRPVIDEIAGPDAALVGLFSITNLYGSEAQPWHSDNQFHLSRRQFPDDYYRIYSIVFALQDTTERMGSTGLCPGTHHCKSLSFEAADEYCIESMPMKTGDALIFDADIFHRGGHHDEYGAKDRVMLFLVLAPSETKDSPRWLPTRYFQLGWNMFGHSIHDFTTIGAKPWTMWQALGISPSSQGGYSFVSYVLRLLANGMTWRFLYLGKERAVTWQDIEDVWQRMLPVASVATCVWVLWLLFPRLFARSSWTTRTKTPNKTL